MTFPNIGKRMLFVIPAIPVAWWIINTTVSVIPSGIGEVFPGQLLVIVLALLACYEYISMLRLLYPRNGFWVGYLWLALQFILYIVNDQTNYKLPYHLGYYILLLLVALEVFGWGRLNRARRWMRASLLFSGVAIIYMCAISLLNFYHAPFQGLFRRIDGPLLSQLGICLIVLAVALCDSFAYFVGCSFGKHRFSTISPHKTIEGAAAGFVAAVLTASIGWWFLAAHGLPRGLGILLGVLIGVFAQFGDLFVSLMKRYFRVKDSSNLIPGHGGVLDRFGSLFFTAPALSIFAGIVGHIFRL
jgi:phosphatidate cytidylyltransferase